MNEWGVRLHVDGRLSMLPDDLRLMISKAMLATRHNNKLRLNIAYAYTGIHAVKVRRLIASVGTSRYTIKSPLAKSQFLATTTHCPLYTVATSGSGMPWHIGVL